MDEHSSAKIPDWIPWEKILTWTLFLLSIYALRHFFLIFFLTFIVSYSMRGVVVLLEKALFRTSGRRGIQTALAVFCFLGLLGGLYGIGAYFVPELASQGQELVKKVSNPKKSHKAQFDEFLATSIGRWLLQQKYGERGTELYNAAFHRSRLSSNEHEEFSEIATELKNDFERNLFQKRQLRGVNAYRFDADNLELREWILRVKAPKELERDRDRYQSEWETLYRKQEFQLPVVTTPLAALTAGEREDALLKFVTAELLKDERVRSSLENEWRNWAAKQYAKDYRRRHSEEYQKVFQNFYEEVQEQQKEELPYSFELFLKLDAALTESPAAFDKALQEYRKETPQQRLEREQAQFERKERLALIGEWKKGELAGKIQTKIEEWVVATMSRVGIWVTEIVPKLLVLPMEILLVLLLSFFITIDVPRLHAGILKLRESRMRHAYDEIVPGLVSFGKLIGRAFQAQGIIALVNTILTFLAIKLLGIQNAAFLCSLVFLCSFIPVLGVVLSSVPIAVVAITQEDGGVMLAVWAIVAILIVHFIETSMLNPKILGDMLHLHPVLVLAILAISEHFFGVWGLLLGVPVAVYIIRFVILEEGIPGFIEHPKKRLLISENERS